VSDEFANSDAKSSTQKENQLNKPQVHERLFRDSETAMLGGVCQRSVALFSILILPLYEPCLSYLQFSADQEFLFYYSTLLLSLKQKLRMINCT